MSQCECANAGEPRDIIDLYTPLYQACGGRLYRLHVTTSAAAVLMGDGATVETRINSLERSLLANTTTYFADTIAGRDALAPLSPGDRCYVFDASADSTVPSGPAMYIWLPSRKWHKLYNGDSPVESQNLIKDGGGLGVENNKLYVKLADLVGDGLKISQQLLAVDTASLCGAGLAVDSQGKLSIKASSLPAQTVADLANLLATNGLKVENGKLGVNLAELIKAAGGLKLDSGKLAVDFAQIPATDLSSLAGAMAKPGGGLAMGSDGKLSVDFSSMPAETLKAMVLPMVKPGGGLQVDASGRIYFDAAGMDTSVFEALMKKLRLPVWQTANTDYYVNKSHAQAGDTLIEGRGLSPDLPFATIQACVNYICENINMGPYYARVNISSHTYEEDLVVGEVARSTGRLVLRSANGGRATIKGNTRFNGCTAQLWGINLQSRAGTSPDSQGFTLLHALGGSDLYLTDVKMQLAADTDKMCYCLNVLENSLVTIYGAEDGESDLTIQLMTGFNKSLLGNVIQIYGAAVEQRTSITLTGSPSFSNFLYMTEAAKYSCSKVYGHSTDPACVGAATGRRYSIHLNSLVNINGKGPEFFPGSTEGLSDTGAQYA